MTAPLRLACVEFINTKPLIEGLRNDPSLALSLHVPSALADELKSERADVALLPVIDYQRLPGLRIVPGSCIGCDGPTLTVRLFAHEPFDRVRRVATDPDSHTSVALAHVLFAKRFQTNPEFIDLREARPDDARLLIGDKVICEAPAGFDHQLDLGQAWKELTGLPFVFATWCAHDGVNVGDLHLKLTRAVSAVWRTSTQSSATLPSRAAGRPPSPGNTSRIT
ncbi:MAG: hypothetical protein QM770_08155 [Tepidisphaeraceae bacterium]